MESRDKEKEYERSIWEIYRKEWETASSEKKVELNKRMRRWQELMKNGLTASQANIRVMQEESNYRVVEEPSAKRPAIPSAPRGRKAPFVILSLALVAALIYGFVVTRDRNALNTKLESVQSVLASTQAELSSTKETLVSTQAELSSAKGTIVSTQAELSSTKQGLASTEAELSSTKKTLTETQDKVKVIEAELLLSNIKVTNLSISPQYANPGEKVTISATVTNSGGIQLEYPAILRIKNSEVETKSVVLNAGESQVVSFIVVKESIGTYTVELGGLSGTFVVVGAQVIKDLAYIKALARAYSDDADPEYEGVDIRVYYYNSKSEWIEFSGVPVKVIVEVNWSNYPPIYREVIMNSSRDTLKIPYSDIPGSEILFKPISGTSLDSRTAELNRQLKIMAGPDLAVVVTTPTQGSFRYSNR